MRYPTVKIKYTICAIVHEISVEDNHVLSLSPCESFDTPQEAEDAIVKYVSDAYNYTILKQYCKE